MIVIKESIKEGVLMSKYNLDKLDTKNRYRMLDRMRGDCEYCINSGSNRHLWVVNDPKGHCDLMRELYDSLEDKPDWLSLEDIDRFEKALLGESLEEDTVKTSDGKWTNKGKEGTHGKFKTKKAADAQRKAMFANGYHENLTVEEDKEAFEQEFGESLVNEYYDPEEDPNAVEKTRDYIIYKDGDEFGLYVASWTFNPAVNRWMRHGWAPILHNFDTIEEARQYALDCVED